MRYPALIEGGGGHYGVVFPDIDGIGATEHSVDEAIANASEALLDYAIEMEKDGLPLATPSALEDVEVPKGCALMSILVVREAPDQPSVRLNLVLDADVANTITSQARSRGMSRKNYIAWMMKTLARMGV